MRAVDIHRAFEGIAVLQGVNLEVRPGEVLGLIGPNGAGKTTLVNILTGFDGPDRGAIWLNGRGVTRLRAHRRARLGLARTFQHGHLFAGLTVRENIEASALGVGASPRAARARADELLARFGLADQPTASAGVLPPGQERRLGMARALATEPRYVLLDEPAAGLNEAEVPAFEDAIRAMGASGTGVLLIEHNVAMILALCDRIVVLDQGVVIAEGDPATIRGDDQVAAAYLGLATDHGPRG
ncbi:ATP-binding cassette domain-containing protein [Egibacter rhizosphaerae]|uniref:ATP-binding cassette domain-containing protein n=1 Tax=Egibacter rhizosphaerae TaxID=1670831 RepID=A0A411YLE0_9ACTN|nr:ATP-binding cassette domain-containing protein [Egibacter rhizosphaerae]